MRSSLFAFIVALLPGCGLYLGDGSSPPAGDDTPAPPLEEYDLVAVQAIGSAHPIVGVDSDRHGGLWVLQREGPVEMGGPAQVIVTHLDAQHAKLSEWVLEDDATPLHGLAYTGEAVWINYAAPAGDGSRVRALDATTGATIASFATATGIVDLEDIDGDLATSVLWNHVDAIDRQTGGITWRTDVSAFNYSTQGGLAYDGVRMWIASWDSHGVVSIVDRQGALIGEAHSALIDAVAARPLPLAWDGDKLVLVDANQITWLAVQPRS